MRYILTQKISLLKEDLFIRNEEGKECFYIEDESLNKGRIYNIYDELNQRVYRLEQTVISFLPKLIVLNDQLETVATIQQLFTLFKPKLEIESVYGTIEVKGDFLAKDYKVYLNDQVIALISKEIFAIRNKYYVEINNDDHAFILAIVLAIDTLLEKTY